ncbi:unnamed protein product [Darwinula stevensoni]|uniref:Protein quiver n=1 Tax=Darwinula stevensoni TaxID=69355 RepID=A0A7R8XF63_9CRUS|nr:unnamed protein product [Darwinula stevensoni]CAG0895952.1 unnamed protein product [Darwinula stevensoni]
MKHLLAIFFVVDLVSFAFAIQCYKCNTRDDEYCEDPFNHKNAEGHLSPCTEKDFTDKTGLPPSKNITFACRKIWQEVRGDIAVFRSCGWEKYYIKERICYKTATEDIHTTVCSCEHDGCNIATTLGSALVLVIASLAGAFLAL